MENTLGLDNFDKLVNISKEMDFVFSNLNKKKNSI